MNLDLPIIELNRVGKALEKRLLRLGIRTASDLLFHFPLRYEDYSGVSSINQLEDGMDTTIRATIELIAAKRSPRKRMVITEAVVSDGSAQMKVVWFGQPYIAKTLKVGDEVFFSGKVKSDMFGVQMTNPSYEKTSARIADSDTVHTARIVPIYPLTTGITQKQIRMVMKQVVPLAKKLEDWIPEDMRDRVDIMEYAEALEQIHFPEDQESLTHAERRLKFDELFVLQLRAEMIRQEVKRETAPEIAFGKEVIKQFVDGLPFTLTKAQKVAAWEIMQDMEKAEPMNRLLEGDVGSGKTVVAAMAALDAINAGFQVAVMAPTEILAVQHFSSFGELLRNAKTLLLTGAKIEDRRLKIGDGSKKKRREEAVQYVGDGTAQLIIGTHALLTEDVVFKNLGLVIVDEQHRFGVEQRRRLLRTNTDKRGKTWTDVDRCGQVQHDQASVLLFEDITYKVRGCLFAVKKNVGLGHKEKIYQNAVEMELKKAGLAFEREKSVDVLYDGKKIGVYRPDFIIEGKVILELKALAFVGQKEKTQIWTYLKGSDYRIALLANFGPKGVETERIVYDTARDEVQSASSLRKSAHSSPHFLSMTATPIPRSFALTLYGDLDLSIINEMPAGRKPVKTTVIEPSSRAAAYGFIADQVKEGRQAFVICPLIDNEQLTISNTQGADKKSVIAEYEKLSKEIFPNLRIAYLHGKQKANEKDETMKQFVTGEIDILVSTSVVEVGVNIPNASVMMIEGADRFGLAQLHQFRGRVGRSDHQSYCFLFTDSDSKQVKDRLTFFEKHTDGFKVAEYDLEMRGPGEVYGKMQSGMGELRLASLQDGELIKLARDTARGIDFEMYSSLHERVVEWEASIHLE